MPPALLSSDALLLAQFGRNIRLDLRTNVLLFSVMAILLIAYIVGRFLRRQPESTANPAVVRTFNLRVRAWAMMFAILIAGFLFGYVATVVLFALVSFWALREFITMTPTRRGDHRTLFWTFFLFTPLQYFLIGVGHEFYGFYTIMIPVYASLFIPARIAISGDPKRFLERVAKIQAALLICVYALSHAPAMLDLELQTADGQPWVLGAPEEPAKADAEEPAPPPAIGAAEPPNVEEQLGSNAGLLFFFVLLVQLNDVFQYMWSQLLGRHVIAPQINASRTWEGFVGGVLSTMLAGMLLYWATPFGFWAGPIAGVIAVAGFAGSMTMSGIKRDRGVKDYGTLVSGHAGVLDRIDSICFAAPVFFHITRFFFSNIG
ncbi:MAG TPA: phosphatidate cytidylyltransferase [Pirellulaceae bacterium]|nr:phosphatidate cytidylyltransferase [Pirellulaceae bacterium]